LVTKEGILKKEEEFQNKKWYIKLLAVTALFICIGSGVMALYYAYTEKWVYLRSGNKVYLSEEPGLFWLLICIIMFAFILIFSGLSRMFKHKTPIRKSTRTRNSWLRFASLTILANNS